MSKKSKKAFPNSTVNFFHHEGDVKIVKAEVEHAGYLQHRLRPSDVRECMIHSSTPWRALHAPFRIKDAHTWTGMYKDEPVCMFGVVPFMAAEDFIGATIWFLGSSVIDEQPRKFLKASKDMFEYISAQYDLLENVVPVDHHKTLKWLDWLGFAFAEEATVINGYSCIRFVRCDESIEVRFQ